MPPNRRRPILLCLLLATLGGQGVSSADETVGPVEVAYTQPVDGSVVSSFEAPSGPYAAGHRGVDLAAVPGATVRAAGDGRVAFAGTVAGVAWVAVDHPDGIRTTYGDLGTVAVPWGQHVRRGEVLGTVGASRHGGGGRAVLHWRARRDGAYLDPMLLVTEPWTPSLVGAGRWEATDLPDVPRYEPWDGRMSWYGTVPASPVAHGPGWVVAPNPNHVIGIAGIDSFSERGVDRPLDLTHLGYDPADITYLSYRGRDDRGGAARDPRRDQQPYAAPDTWDGVHAAAVRLREQLRAQWAREPGRAVDLVGHSLGGVVAMYYLLNLHDPTDPSLPPIGNVATLASPLEGADLATAVVQARADPAGRLLVEGLSRLIPDRDGTTRTVTDLALGSDTTRSVQDGWDDALADRFAGPLANGTRVLTLGGSRDLVVPDHRADLPGAEHRVLPGGHGTVRETEASRIAVRAFLAGDPVPGGSGGLGNTLTWVVGQGQQQLDDAALWLATPTRLVKVARTAGRWVGKAGRAVLGR